MKIAATVIIYHPKLDVHENISSYLPYFDLLIISDNSEPNADDFLLRYKNESNVIILKNKENEGIAKPLNIAAEIAINKGYNWLLTMDQDSSFEAGDFRNYLNCLAGINAYETAMVGINYEKKTVDADICTTSEVPLLITSGSFLNLGIYSKVGPFNEALFIDFVDSDYCWRSRLKGFKILQLRNIFLTHHLGEMVQAGFIFSKGQTIRKKYGTSRIYYMVRNYLHLNKSYGKLFKKEFQQQKKVIYNTFKNNLLYKNERVSLVKTLLTAYSHAQKGVMGKRYS